MTTYLKLPDDGLPKTRKTAANFHTWVAERESAYAARMAPFEDLCREYGWECSKPSAGGVFAIYADEEEVRAAMDQAGLKAAAPGGLF